MWLSEGNSATSPLSLLTFNCEMLKSCTKRLHGNEHISGIMHNLEYDVHVTFLDAHDCIMCTFPRISSVLAFLYWLNGCSLVEFNELCLVFWNVLHVSALAEGYKYFLVLLLYFAFISTCLHLTYAYLCM